MFKNLILFRIGPDWNPGLATLEAGLDKNRFVPCGPTQQKSLGWVEPRGEAGGALVESVGGHWLLKLLTEQRVVPSSAVKGPRFQPPESSPAACSNVVSRGLSRNRCRRSS